MCIPPAKHTSADCLWANSIVSSSLALLAVLHVGVGPIAATGGLDVPLALLVLVFDDLGEARHALLLGRSLGGCQCLRVGGEGLRENAVDLVGPAAVMLDDFIRDVRHWSTFAVRDG